MNHLKDGRIGRNKWHVITGGPCSGKTTIVNMLAERGYKTTVEDARHYIDSQLAVGKTVKEIRKHQAEFQLKVLNLQIDQEGSLSPDELVFLDRAIPDARAYYMFLDIPEDDVLTKMMAIVSYKKIFILDYLPLVEDYARQEDRAAQKAIHHLITEVYGSLPFPIIHVPVLPPEQRVDLILKNL